MSQWSSGKEPRATPTLLPYCRRTAAGASFSSMRRALLLASTLAAAAIAGALLYRPASRFDDRGSVPASSAVEVVRSQATQPPLAAAAEIEPNVSAPEPTGDAVAQGAQDARSADPPGYREAIRRRGPPRDEATILADLRKQALQDVRQTYSLLLDDLDLTPQQREDLVAVFVELQVESAWTGAPEGGFQKRGRTIPPQERQDRIAAAIGDERLDEFLVLEVNLAAYWETQQIGSLLRRKGLPLTQAQRDGVLEIVLEVRDRYPHTEPEADLDPRSLERLEHEVRQLDDFDRHVVELAPSVLSATQVAHLFDEYQWMSRQRIDAVEMQKKRRVERPDDDMGTFLPARWNPR